MTDVDHGEHGRNTGKEAITGLIYANWLLYESIERRVSGGRLPHFGPFPSWNFAPWSRHAVHSIPKIDLKWDCLSACVHAQTGRSSTQSFAVGSYVSAFSVPSVVKMFRL